MSVSRRCVPELAFILIVEGLWGQLRFVDRDNELREAKPVMPQPPQQALLIHGLSPVLANSGRDLKSAIVPKQKPYENNTHESTLLNAFS
ncbi:hypothetical protein EJB05_16400, partial [Eragrostis curvula]